MQLLQRVYYRRGVVHERVPADQAGEHHNYCDVENGTDHQRGDDPNGQIALWFGALFGGGGNRIESDIGEEHDGTARENSGPAVGREGMPIRRVNQARGKAYEDHDGDDFEQHHDVVGAR